MKNYLLGAASLLVVAAAGIGGYSYYQEQQIDQVIRENVEALTFDESSSCKCDGVGQLVYNVEYNGCYYDGFKCLKCGVTTLYKASERCPAK